MQSKVSLAFKKNLQLARIEIGDGRRLRFRNRLERQRFGAVLKLSANRRYSLEQDFAAARGEPLGKRARNEQPEKAAEHDKDIESCQRALEPAAGEAITDMHREQHTREQTGVDVELQPRLRGKQRQEWKLLATVVK